jgi:hypothetical protein
VLHSRLGRCADEYAAELRPDRAAIRRRDRDIETAYEVAVVTDVNAEVRRVTLANAGKRTRTLGAVDRVFDQAASDARVRLA